MRVIPNTSLIQSAFGSSFEDALRSMGMANEAVSRYKMLHDAANRALDLDCACSREGRRQWVVPGRIEVLGKHTDYAGGRSLLCTADRGMVLVSVGDTGKVFRVIDAVRQGAVSIDLDTVSAMNRMPRGWTLYPHVVANRLVQNFGDKIRGTHVAMASGMPASAGMSSSSAFTIALVLALASRSGLAETDLWRDSIVSDIDFAAYCGAIENGRDFSGLKGDAGVGTMGGAQDQTAIICSRQNQLGMFAWAPTEHETWLEWPDEYVFAVGVSGVVASKAGAAKAKYNRAALTTSHLLDLWNANTDSTCPNLYSAISSSATSYEMLMSFVEKDVSNVFDIDHLKRRLEQFKSETDIIIPTAAKALINRDIGLFGEMVSMSQAYAESALENQVDQTVMLVNAARENGAFAASAFGAGFGGSVWAMIHESEASSFLKKWREAYIKSYPSIAARASWFCTKPAPPALEIVCS